MWFLQLVLTDTSLFCHTGLALPGLALLLLLDPLFESAACTDAVADLQVWSACTVFTL